MAKSVSEDALSERDAEAFRKMIREVRDSFGWTNIDFANATGSDYESLRNVLKTGRVLREPTAWKLFQKICTGAFKEDYNLLLESGVPRDYSAVWLMKFYLRNAASESVDVLLRHLGKLMKTRWVQRHIKALQRPAVLIPWMEIEPLSALVANAVVKVPDIGNGNRTAIELSVKTELRNAYFEMAEAWIRDTGWVAKKAFRETDIYDRLLEKISDVEMMEALSELLALTEELTISKIDIGRIASGEAKISTKNRYAPFHIREVKIK